MIRKNCNWKNWTAFIIVVIITISFLNAAYFKYILTKKLDYRRQLLYEDFINTQNNSIDFAFLGTSRTQGGINPEYIQNSFNFGHGGRGILEIYYFLEDTVSNNNGIKIKNIVLESDFFVFIFKPNSEPPLEYAASKDYLGICFQNITQIGSIKSWFRGCLPIAGNGKDLYYIRKPIANNVFKNGYTPFVALSEPINFSKDAHAFLNSINKKHTSTELVDCYIKILKLAKDSNINVILIKLPMSKEFNDVLLENGINQTFYNENADLIAKSILGNVTVLDYYDDYFDNHEYFYDLVHLNSAGSLNLSKKIAEDLKELNNK